MSYAENTKVNAASSQADIVRMLARRGITKHAFSTDGEVSAVMFAYGGLTYRITVHMPPSDHPEFHRTDTGRQRTANAAYQAWEAETRRRWRSLVLLIKAKLVAVDDEITTFEEEFMAHIVTDQNITIGEQFLPRIKEAASLGKMPSQLALGSGK